MITDMVLLWRRSLRKILQMNQIVMILPIKALDKNGKGTVLSIALAIKYAKSMEQMLSICLFPV